MHFDDEENDGPATVILSAAPDGVLSVSTFFSDKEIRKGSARHSHSFLVSVHFPVISELQKLH
jgi:hypothetical protein